MNSLISKIKQQQKQIKKSVVIPEISIKNSLVLIPEEPDNKLPINNDKLPIKNYRKVVEIEKPIVIVSYDPNDTTLYL